MGLSADAAQEENLLLRAQARMQASASFRLQSHQALPGDAQTAASGANFEMDVLL